MYSKLILALCFAIFPIAPNSPAAALAAPSPAPAVQPSLLNFLLPLLPVTPPQPIPSPPPLSWGEYHATGPASCNCPSGDGDSEEHTVCVSSTVKVKIGNEYISVETGVSEGTCATKRLKPGKCLYYVYNFVCTSGGWFSKPTCTYISAGTFTRDSTTRDCPDPPKGL